MDLGVWHLHGTGDGTWSNDERDFRVVAEADSAASAYSAFKQHSPHVVVLDISMPGASGLEAIRNIRSRDNGARILVFSMHTETVLVKAAFDAGAVEGDSAVDVFAMVALLPLRVRRS